MKFGLSEDTYIKLKEVVNKYSNYKFKIFGSRARGDYKNNSDIDIAIEGNVDRKEKFVTEFDKLETKFNELNI